MFAHSFEDDHFIGYSKREVLFDLHTSENDALFPNLASAETVMITKAGFNDIFDLLVAIKLGNAMSKFRFTYFIIRWEMLLKGMRHNGGSGRVLENHWGQLVNR